MDFRDGQEVMVGPGGASPYYGTCSCGSSKWKYRSYGGHIQPICKTCGEYARTAGGVKWVSRYENALKDWKHQVKLRDGEYCKRCGAGPLNGKACNVHHKLPVWFMPELGTDPENGIVLCTECHKHLHGGNGTIKVSE